jgi:glycosyltransferase involved in cell wall biosynthesis
VAPVVLDTPVAREVYRDAALYVPAGDVTAAAGAIRRLLLDPGQAAPLLARGRDLLRLYSWDAAAEATLAAIERIARP